MLKTYMITTIYDKIQNYGNKFMGRTSFKFFLMVM